MSASHITKKLAVLFGLLLVPGIALADYTLNMTQGITPVSKEVYGLHQLVMWICTVAGILVFSVMIYSIINHRKSKGAVAAQFHESATVEVIWTVIPLIILVAIAIPATKTLLDIEDPSKSDVTIQVTGWQWKWNYNYRDEDLSFFSNLATDSNEARQLGADTALRDKADNYLLNVDKPIVVPVNKKVSLLITSNDVLHAWWVPALAVKRDAIPGYINESHFTATKTGTYRGQCAELCGKDHGFMPIVVKVVEQSEYTAWVTAQKAAAAAAAGDSNKTFTQAELMKKGEAVYKANCAACHQANGTGGGPFPALKGSKVATTGSVADHLKLVIAGKGIMPPFGPQLNDADIAAVVTYERNAWGNSTGDTVQPAAAKAAR